MHRSDEAQEEIPKLLVRLPKAMTLFMARRSRSSTDSGGILPLWVTKVALQNVMGAEIARQVCAFRSSRTQVAKAFERYEGSFVSIDVLLTWGTNRFAAIPVNHTLDVVTGINLVLASDLLCTEKRDQITRHRLTTPLL